jgi:diacylglycerol kinase (ATP)
MKNETGNIRKFSLAARGRSFSFAASGVGHMLMTQHNAWIHMAFTIVVLGAGCALEVDAADWRWLTLAIVMVWAAEALNTAFEHVCDVVSPGYHPSVQLTKDIAAGAVLICAGGAAVLGALTLGPYLLRLL